MKKMLDLYCGDGEQLMNAQEEAYESLAEEYERNGERLNDIEAHYQEARWDMPEWRQLIQRQRELEPIIHPAGDDPLPQIKIG